MLRWFSLLIVVPALLGCAPESNGYELFTLRLTDGASCQELFGIRNAMPPKDRLKEQMGEDLRGIGCFWIDRERRPSPEIAKAAVANSAAATGDNLKSEARRGSHRGALRRFLRTATACVIMTFTPDARRALIGSSDQRPLNSTSPTF